MFKVKKLEKTAGTNIPSDQKLWPAEVLKALVSEHPYVDTSDVKITFTRIEPETKTTMGKIIIAKSAAVPFSIRPDEKTKKLKLDPLDILFDGERFLHMNEDSLRRAIDKQQIGRLVKKKDSVPPGNRYIGDQTGDVTPLEWSAYPSGFAGPRTTATAGQGLLSYVIKNQQDVTKLFNLLNKYDGVNSTVEALGLRDSLVNLKDGMVEGIETKRMAHVMRRPQGGFAVAFDDGDTRAIEAKDLRKALGTDFEPVMRHVMRRGWAIIRDFPTIRSVDCEALKVLPAPIEIGGRYKVITTDGQRKNAIVCDQMIDFDGTILKVQKAICEDDGSYAEGKAMQGWRIPEIVPEAFDEYKRQGALLRKRDYPVGSHIRNFPIGVIDTGVEGCFVDESWGSPKATPSFKINKIIQTPNDPDILIAKRSDTKEEIGLVIVEALVRPQKIRPGHYDPALLPKNSYYMPAHMVFVETPKKFKVMDKEAIVEGRVPMKLKKNAGRYHGWGHTKEGQIQWSNATPAEIRTKLAWHGVDDEVLEDIMEMGDGEEVELYDLEPQDPIETKIASQRIDVPLKVMRTLKVAAEDAIKGVEDEPEARDPRTIDSILSLQFVSEENLADLLDSSEVFEECEDRLARLLLAARQGEKSIHEKGVQRALRGIGEARKTLKTLEIELQSRET